MIIPSKEAQLQLDDDIISFDQIGWQLQVHSHFAPPLRICTALLVAKHNDLSAHNSNPANSQANIDRCKNKIIHD